MLRLLILIKLVRESLAYSGLIAGWPIKHNIILIVLLSRQCRTKVTKMKTLHAMAMVTIRRDIWSIDKDSEAFYTKIPIAPCYCQMMGQTLKEEIKITQYNNPTKAGKYSLEDLFRASDNIPHHYPKF